MLPNDYTSFIGINSTGGIGNIPVRLIVAGSSLPGDVNGDAILNVLDVVTLVNFVVGSVTPENWQFSSADMNSDSILNVLDIVLLINDILSE